MGSWKKDSSGNWKKSSGSSKNYTIVDGKKVLKSSVESSASSVLSNSWDKSTVTLEEAKQQSTQASSYLLAKEQEANAASGVVSTVDTGAVDISDSWNKESISLTQAANQTSQAQSYLIAKDTQTQENQAAQAQAQAEAIAQAEAVEASKSAMMQEGLVGSNSSMYQDLTGQYVPSIVSSEYATTYLANKEAEKVQAAKRAIAESQTMQLIGGFGGVIDLQGTTEKEKTRSERLSDFLVGTSNKVKSNQAVQSASGAVSAVTGSEVAKKVVAVEDTILGAMGMPTITQAIDTGSNVVNTISEAASYGFSGGSSGSIKTSDKEYLTSGIARKGQEYAGKISEKGSALVSSGVDLLAGKDNVIQVPSLVGTNQVLNIPASTAKSFVTGATVDMASFVVGGVAGVPQLAEVAARDPTQLAGALVGGVGLVAGSTAKMMIDEPAKFVGNVVGGAVFGKVGGDVAGSVKVGKAQIVKQTSGGAKATYETIDYGAQISIADNPLLSFSKESGVKVGKGVAAPMDILDTNTPITAFSKTQTSNFIATLEKHGIEADYFKAGQNIAKSVNRTPTPVKAPTSFEITSSNIPDSAKPIVKKALQDFSGDIEVYGSVAQKAQMGQYMTKLPGDIDIMVANDYALTAKLAADMGKQGQRYKLKGLINEKTRQPIDNPHIKINFAGEKGIEIFSSLEDAGSGYHPNSQVAYGLKSFDPIKVDKVGLMDLREQGARKLSGGLTIKKGSSGTASIEPVHKGRVKDVSDLVEIGVGHALEKRPGIAGDVIDFNRFARQKYPEHMATSRLSNFIDAQGRLPGKNEIGQLVDMDVGGSHELLFKKVKEPESVRGSSAASKMINKGGMGSISLAAVSSSAKTSKGKGSQGKYPSQSIGKVDLNLPSFVSPSPGIRKPDGGNKKTPYPGSAKKTTPSTPFMPPSIPKMPGYTPPGKPTPPSLPTYPGGDDGTVIAPLPSTDLFDFTTPGPGKRMQVVLPGTSKRAGTKKNVKRKGNITPGMKKNKYINPLEIKFKL